MNSDSQSCSGCPNTDKCREVWAEANNGPLTAGGLAIFSVVAFLFPILAAIIGGAAATAMEYSEVVVMLFAGGGFAVAALAAAIFVNCLKKRFAKPNCDMNL